MVCHTSTVYRTSVCQRMNIRWWTLTHMYARGMLDIGYTVSTFQARSHTVAYDGIRRGKNNFKHV